MTYVGSANIIQPSIEAIITAELAIAIHIYNCKNEKYPETLNELVPDIVKELPPDAFTGKNFVYKRQGNGFVGYSLGTNLTDDGGKWGRPMDDIAWKSGELAEVISMSKYKIASGT